MAAAIQQLFGSTFKIDHKKWPIRLISVGSPEIASKNAGYYDQFAPKLTITTK